MNDPIILDLGDDYGSILVIPTTIPTNISSEKDDEGIVPASGIGDALEALSKTGKKLQVSARELFGKPLKGIANLFVLALPDLNDMNSAVYRLEEFSVDFEIGIAAEGGPDAGIKLTVTPNGSFKCSYTWKRKPDENKANNSNNEE